MGDGHTEVCDSPGTPYEPRFSGLEPRGSGASGDDWFLRESSTSVEIHELQVVTS